MKKYLYNRVNSLGDLIALANERRPQPGGLISIGHAAETGFHVYSKLRLGLDLAAADSEKNSQRFLKTINAYVQIASECAQTYSLSLLEVQCEMLHFFLPCSLGEDAVAKIVAFSKDLFDAVEEHVRPIADSSFKAFAMAADHGGTVFVHKGNGASQSVISLSPAANEPAKILAEDPNGGVRVRHGQLMLKPDHLDLVGVEHDKRCSWIAIPLDNLPFDPKGINQWVVSDYAILNRNLSTNIALANERMGEYLDPNITVYASNEIPSEMDIISATADAPVLLQGFFMRADLDGFTSMVSDAFDKGPEAIRALVENVALQMEYAEVYNDDVESAGRAKVCRLPWAGDCANMFVVPRESYRLAQKYLPVMLAARWHEQLIKDRAPYQKWAAGFGDSQWALSVAGGNSSGVKDSGYDGYALVASVHVGSRSYRIVAGWNSRRSQDALLADGVVGDDTVLHKADCQELSEDNRKLFKDLKDSTLFRRARKLNLSDLQQEAIKRKSQHRETVMATAAGSSLTLPRTPYADTN